MELGLTRISHTGRNIQQTTGLGWAWLGYSALTGSALAVADALWPLGPHSPKQGKYAKGFLNFSSSLPICLCLSPVSLCFPFPPPICEVQNVPTTCSARLMLCLAAPMPPPHICSPADTQKRESRLAAGRDLILIFFIATPPPFFLSPFLFWALSSSSHTVALPLSVSLVGDIKSPYALRTALQTWAPSLPLGPIHSR